MLCIFKVKREISTVFSRQLEALRNREVWLLGQVEMVEAAKEEVCTNTFRGTLYVNVLQFINFEIHQQLFSNLQTIKSGIWLNKLYSKSYY